MTANVQTVFAVGGDNAPEESQVQEEYTDTSGESQVQEEYTDPVEETNSEEPDPEPEDRANSWRYTDGQPYENRSRARARAFTGYTTWPTNVEGAVGYGIDVSEHQGVIDWSKVKAAGVDFAIVRCGYGSDSVSQDDDYWKINADACEQYNIPFGTYLYSYADTVAKARSEAQHVLRLVEGYKLSYPIYYDLEENSIRNKLSRSQIADIAEAFCDTIEAAGYEAAIYANTDWLTNYLTDSRFDQWDKWCAQYNTTCTYTGSYSMWQCSSTGRVDGISGNVDLNVDLGAALAAHFIPGANGFNQSPANDEWYYYQNGEVQYGLEDVIKGTVDGVNAWWHVSNGKVVYDTTVAKNSKGWWYIENGKVDFSANTVAKNSKGWWVIRDGKVNFNYNGFAENQNGWWYCKGGKVQFETTTVVNGTVDGETAWWYVEKGKVNKSYNGLGSNSNGTWLVENGRVDFSFSGKKTINGVEYTFKEGRCMNNYRGWKKLGGKYYYFDRNTGAQMKNCTVDGIRLNSDGSAVSSAYNNEKIRTMIKARSIMESITNKSDSKETKLRKCFDWVMKHPYKRYRTLKVARQKAGWEMLFANDHFERGQGCCVADACAFAFLAHECGYGTVYICDGGSHAWVEINGYLYDPMMAEEAGYDKYYHSNYKKANFSITSDQVNRKKI